VVKYAFETISDLYINNNDSLSTCQVISICDYLASPNGTIEIYNNAAGCNSRQEVEEACGVGMEENSSPENQLNIYPNPTSTNITIETTSCGPIFILNLDGKELLQKKITEPSTIIDISTFPCGIYFVKVVGEKGVWAGKFMKQ
jgi:hypothetical protein